MVQAHPRSRGEHFCCLIHGSLSSGSSPLARGTLVEQSVLVEGERLIPARAGNTSCAKAWMFSSSAHPRSRGEHIMMPIPVGLTCGSSPLARGTPWSTITPTSRIRLIPARAGNTFPPGREVKAGQAHPRSRGEHCPCRLLYRILLGSSPLARGPRVLTHTRDKLRRLIPARAGNTEARPSIILGHHGSSPLARGTRKFVRCLAAGNRLIPARAGNTLHSYRSFSKISAHPRSRGEHTDSYIGDRDEYGSSPLARGTPLLPVRA